MSMMNLQAFAISIDSNGDDGGGGGSSGSSDGSGDGGSSSTSLLFASATLSSFKFTHFLKRFLQFNYFGWIVVGEIHQRFTKYSPEVLVVLRKVKGKKNKECKVEKNQRKIEFLYNIFRAYFSRNVNFSILPLWKNVSLPDYPVSNHRMMLPSCSYLWRPTSIQQYDRCPLYCVELWIYNSRTKTVCECVCVVPSSGGEKKRNENVRSRYMSVHRVNHHKMGAQGKQKINNFQTFRPHLLSSPHPYTYYTNTRTLSATFLCNINGNTCSDNFLSGTRLFSQP